ncbi:MAG: type II secretion system protein [Fervidobacterium sp.]
MKKGFTLIELLIVMAIIAALMSVATPVGINALSQAKATNVAANFSTLQKALMQLIMFEQNIPTNVDLVDYLYTNGYITNKPQGFEIVYNDTDKSYIIRHLNTDVDPIKVKSINPSVQIDTNNKLILKVAK